MHRPRPLLSLARPLILLFFWFVLPQIQHDRLVIHSTVKLLLVHPLENKPSVSFPLPLQGLFQFYPFFPFSSHNTLFSLRRSFESMPFCASSVTFSFKKITLYLLSFPKICFSKRSSLPRFSLFFFSVNENFPTSEHKGKKPHASLQPN